MPRNAIFDWRLKRATDCCPVTDDWLTTGRLPVDRWLTTDRLQTVARGFVYQRGRQLRKNGSP